MINPQNSLVLGLIIIGTHLVILGRKNGGTIIQTVPRPIEY